MRRTRIWRLATAAVAATALLMTASAGVATAQSPGDLTGPLEDLLGEVGGDDGDDGETGEGGDGPTGTPLDDLIGALDPEQLGQLEDTLDPEQLQDLLDTLGLQDLQDLLDPESLPGGDEGDDSEEGPAVTDGEAGDGTVPGAEMGGFIGTARGSGLEVGVGLPEALADGLEPLLTELGIRDPETGGIRIAFAETEAQLQRAGEGEEVDGLARALATNLLLDSESAGSPGECTGGDTVALPPGQDPPLIELTIVNIDCEQDDERAFADAQLAGAEITLAGLIEAGLPVEARDGLDQALTPINEQLLGALNDACGDVLGAILDPLLPENQACEALELQINNPLDLGIPVVDVDLLGSTSEVTADSEQVAADASATLEQVNVLGLVCLGGDDTDPLTYTASAMTAGGEGTYETSAPDAQLRVCDNDASILRLISDSAPLEDIDVLEEDLPNLLDGQLSALFDGLDELLNALNTATVTNGAPYGETDGAGAVGGVTPLTIVGTAPLADIPGLNEFLGDLSVRVEAMEVEAATNAEPADQVESVNEEDEVESAASEPEGDLPTTGASAAGALGLAALLGAVALRRRED